MLKELMKAKKISQKDLAINAGLAPSHLCALLAKKHKAQEFTAEQIIRAFFALGHDLTLEEQGAIHRFLRHRPKTRKKTVQPKVETGGDAELSVAVTAALLIVAALVAALWLVV